MTVPQEGLEQGSHEQEDMIAGRIRLIASVGDQVEPKHLATIEKITVKKLIEEGGLVSGRLQVQETGGIRDEFEHTHNHTLSALGIEDLRGWAMEGDFEEREAFLAAYQKEFEEEFKKQFVDDATAYKGEDVNPMDFIRARDAEGERLGLNLAEIEDYIMENQNGLMSADHLIMVFKRQVEGFKEGGMLPERFKEPGEWHEDEDLVMSTANQVAITAMNRTFEDLEETLDLDPDNPAMWSRQYESRSQLASDLISSANSFEKNYLNLVNPESIKEDING